MKKYLTMLLMMILMLSGCHQKTTAVAQPAYDFLEHNAFLTPAETRTVALLDITTYDSIYVLINKNYALPADYVPDDLVVLTCRTVKSGMLLRQAAAQALEEMFDAAAAEGIELMVGSAYRSYSTQVRIYNSCVASAGTYEADRACAVAGHSEHQTGLAVDLTDAAGQCYLQQCFANTAAGQWLKANAYRFGFILRYTTDKESITGYKNEPWHYRYVGIAEATAVMASGLCLEEYYGIIK